MRGRKIQFGSGANEAEGTSKGGIRNQSAGKEKDGSLRRNEGSCTNRPVNRMTA